MSNKHLFQAYLIFSNQQLVLKLHTGGFGPFSIIGTYFLITILPKNRDNGVFTSTPKIRNLSNLSQNFFVSFFTCIKDVYRISKLNINLNRSYAGQLISNLPYPNNLRHDICIWACKNLQFQLRWKLLRSSQWNFSCF